MDEDELAPLVPANHAAGPSGPSGHEKRRKKAELPKVFFIYDMGIKVIVGAAVFLKCVESATSASVDWHIARPVSLLAPFQLTKEMSTYKNRVFNMVGPWELEVRMKPARAGGTLNGHFIDFAHVSWKVFCFRSADCNKLFGPTATLDTVTILQSENTIPRVAGLTAEPAPVAEARHDDGDAGEEYDVPWAPYEPPGPVAGGDNVDPEADEIRNLVKRNLTNMSTLSGGAVTHRFTPAAIVGSLKLASSLRPGATLENALADASCILFGSGNAVERDILNKKFYLPSIASLRVARLKLDLFSIMYERRLFLRWDPVFYFMCDSSPQLGSDFLCMIESRILVPAAHSYDIALRAKLNLHAAFEERLAPLSTLGMGRAGLTKKSDNTFNFTLMETGTVELMNRKRMAFRGAATDQGTEKDIGDTFISILPQFRNTYANNDPDIWFYPKLLEMPDHLHVIYNSLERHVKIASYTKTSLKIYGPFKRF